MPFSDIFNQKSECKENDCKVNKKNIKKIFKPDDGFLNVELEKKLFDKNYKICDCIIICQDDSIIVHEILCGKLTYSEYKDKVKQLSNCLTVLQYLGLIDRVKKVILQHKKLSKKDILRNSQFKKRLINHKIKDIQILRKQEKLANIEC